MGVGTRMTSQGGDEQLHVHAEWSGTMEPQYSRAVRRPEGKRVGPGAGKIGPTREENCGTHNSDQRPRSAVANAEGHSSHAASRAQPSKHERFPSLARRSAKMLSVGPTNAVFSSSRLIFVRLFKTKIIVYDSTLKQKKKNII